MILGGLVVHPLIRARIKQSVMLLTMERADAGRDDRERWHTNLIAFTHPLSTSPALTDPLVSVLVPTWPNGDRLGIVAGMT